MIKNRKFFTDIILNIIAGAMPMAMLQLIIYPKIAKVAGGDEYGLMLTIYSVWIMVSNSLGNVLNNIKLLKYPQYRKNGYAGDMPVILRNWTALNTLIVFAAVWAYCGEFSVSHVVLGILIAGAILLRAYLEVGFRIKLDYVAVIIDNGLLSIGFLLGFYIFRLTGVWEFVFLFGYCISCAFCAVKTDLLKEPMRKTPMYKGVIRDSYSLVTANVIDNVINYADKLLLYPLMGGTAVSIYYTATILGKIASMLTGPINSVVLSYITKWDKARTHIFSKVLIAGTAVTGLGYAATLILARPVLGMLFPQWIDRVMDIIAITTVAVMLSVMASILQPFVLKFCDVRWQILISSVSSSSYFCSALLLWKFYGLTGFCVGTVVGASIKILIMIIVYYTQSKKISDSSLEGKSQQEG